MEEEQNKEAEPELNKNQSNNEGGLEEISNQDLIKYVKERNKEIKKLTQKLSKVEEKYINIFKENKVLKSERDMFEKVFETLFSTEQFQKKKSYEFDYLINLWKQVQSKHEADIKNLTIEFQSTLEQKTKEIESTTKTDTENFKNKIKFLEETAKKFNGDILDLNNVIMKQNCEINRLKEIEKKYVNFQGQQLIMEMQKVNNFEFNDMDLRFKESDRVNQLIKLQNELEKAYEKIDKLTSLFKSGTSPENNSTEQLFNKIFIECSNKEVQTDGLDQHKKLNESLNNNHDLNRISSIQKNHSIHNSTDRLPSAGEFQVIASDERYNVHVKYIKNIILKYFIYQASQNTKEAAMLMEVILDFLQVGPQEKQLLSDAKKKIKPINK